ncbi:AMP-binding protein [Tistlia consotensis]|uniref:AMP-binding protein n=1 Tax=Tistlia consotensis TaxID=1321365 RepID=UPI00190ED066|nr:AMP-binding protein [Tistlia consotensis]
MTRGPDSTDDAVAWRPDAATVAGANLTAFLAHCGVADEAALEALARAEPERFWQAVIDFAGLRFERPWERLLDLSRGAPWARWCVGATTNVVLSCLDRWRGTATEAKTAIDWEGEDGSRRLISYGELDAAAGRVAAGLAGLGLEPGDVVGLYLPNLPEAVVAFLAVARLGGIVLPLFSGFGAEAVADRLGDAGAVAVITADSAPRRGRPVPMKSVVDAAAARLPGLRHLVVLRHGAGAVDWVPGRDLWWSELEALAAGRTLPTRAVEADAPLMLVYTSGTTGRAKGTVHSHCGFAAKIALDLGIYLDFKASDRILWMSDLGWLVGPILIVGTTLLGGTLVLAEGAPDYPEPDRIWRLVEQRKVSFLGMAPTLARALMRHDPAELARHDLSSLRLFASTGEPWTPDAWNWVFQSVGRGRVPLLNYAGGTEVGGILASTLRRPLKPCSFAGPIAGCGADIVDAEGRSLPPGEVGELVMRQPSIGLTRGLWREPERYLESYWRTIPGLWVHGDFASRDAEGFWFIHGRSDDTIKIAGKRTGPAEVEALLLAGGRLAEAAVVGLPDPVKGSALVCVCVPLPAAPEPEALAAELEAAVVAGLGSSFRPRRVLLVEELPKTRNMKVMRRVVRAVLQGDDPGNLDALVNPEAVARLQQLVEGREDRWTSD